MLFESQAIPKKCLLRKLGNGFALTLIMTILIAQASHVRCFLLRQSLQGSYRSQSYHQASSQDVLAINPQYQTTFDVTTPVGRCTGVSISSQQTEQLSQLALGEDSHWLRKFLHPREIEYGRNIQSDTTRRSFLLGRLALRRALQSLQTSSNVVDREWLFSDDCVLLKDEYGRPCLPRGFLGSISHKDTTAVGLICPGAVYGKDDEPLSAIGVDLEYCIKARKNFGRRVLTASEMDSLGQVDDMDLDTEVRLRFSAKEAVYKAMHPLICQYVSFKEAEVQPYNDGTLGVKLDLTSKAHERFGKVEAYWQRVGDFFLTSARVEVLDGRPEECRIHS